jgi:hypothetical protein
MTGMGVHAQEDDDYQTTGAELTNNVLDYSVPFLTIAPDSRAGAMGDAGVATSPDDNSLHWNPAKYAFIGHDMSLAVSYTPWLRNLASDIDLGYLSGHYRLDEQQVISGSLLYFSLGEIIFRDNNNNYAGQHTPNEFSIDAAYSRKFGDHFSGGVAFRYIRSDLTGGTFTGGTETTAGNAVAADVSMFYQEKGLEISDTEFDLRFGMNIRNIGSKISYTNERKNFIPTNMKIGTSVDFKLDEYNSLMVTADVNKLLVPTPPVRVDDSIVAGMDPDVSPVQGIVQSFYDAPGGMEEELHELKYSLGMEYWYQKAFAVRAGYFHEHQTKGNRKYFTVGVGLKLNVFRADFAYLIPRYQNNPLANTMRFTIALDFKALQQEKKNTD